jgi:predicted  nucleic acid-binding Zn-ribbon protein
VQGTAPSPTNELKGLKLTYNRTKKELVALQAQAERDKERIAMLEAQVESLREKKKTKTVDIWTFKGMLKTPEDCKKMTYFPPKR